MILKEVKIKIILINFLFSVGSNFIISQPSNYKWNWSFTNSGHSDDYVEDLVIDKNKNIVLCGSYEFSDFQFCNKYYNDGFFGGTFISKLDSLGHCLWTKDLIVQNSSFGIPCISINNENKIFVAGEIQGTFKIDTSTFLGDSILGSLGVIFQLNEQGSLLSIKPIFPIHNSEKEGVGIAGMQFDAENNLYILGITTSAGIIINGVQYDNFEQLKNYHTTFIAKFNKDGIVLWVKFISSNGIQRPIKIILNSNNELILSGYLKKNNYFDSCYIKFDNLTFYNNSYSKNGANSDIFIAKIDTAGRVIWAKLIGGKGDEFGGELAIDGKDNIYLSGNYSSDSLSFDSNILVRKSKGLYSDFLLMKFDSAGVPLWQLSYYFGWTNNDWFPIKVDNKDNVYIYNKFSDPMIVVNSDTFYNNGLFNYILMIYNKDKNISSAFSFGSDGADEISPFLIDHTGNLIITGSFSGENLTLGNNSFKNIGRSVPPTNEPTADIFIANLSIDLSTNTINSAFDQMLFIYPNPVMDNLVINDSDNQIVRIDIYDNTGKLILKQSFQKFTRNKSIETQALVPGLYFAKLYGSKDLNSNLKGNSNIFSVRELKFIKI